MQCPSLAEPPLPIIITADNIDSIKVSTYARVPGTRVTVTCFVQSFTLIGENVLTCQTNGQWDKPVPRCASDDKTSPSTTTASTPPPIPEDLSQLPFMILAALIGLVCLFLAILICCAAYQWRQVDKKRTRQYKRSLSPGTATTSLQDYMHPPIIEHVSRDNFIPRPWPSVSTVGSFNRLISRDSHMPFFIPRPSWFTMLPSPEDSPSPYIHVGRF